MRRSAVVVLAIVLMHAAHCFPHVQSPQKLHHQSGSVSRRTQAASITLEDGSVGLRPAPTQISVNGEKRTQRQVATSEKRARSTLANLMVMLGGAANVLCYKSFGFYATMMTGNTIRFCSAVADMRLAEAVFFASTVISYTAGAALFRLLAIRQNPRNVAEAARKRRAFGILSLTAFAAFAGTDVLTCWLHLPKKWVGSLLALGFGFVNAVSIDETSCVTWAATGHINKLGIGAVDATMLGVKNKGVESSIRLFATFVASVLVTSVMCNKAASLSHVLNVLPPIGTCLGICYASAMGWYASRLGSADELSKAADTIRESVIWWSPFSSDARRVGM